MPHAALGRVLVRNDGCSLAYSILPHFSSLSHSRSLYYGPQPGGEKKNPHVMTKRVCVRANETDEIALLGGQLGFLSCL